MSLNREQPMRPFLDELADAFEGDMPLEYVRTFGTVAEMQAATDLKAGMTCHTNGFHAAGDGGAAYYSIGTTETANGMDVLACAGGLFAVFVPTNEINVVQFGADNAQDNETDSTSNVQRCIDYVAAMLTTQSLVADWNQSGGIVRLPAGTYNVTNLTLSEGITLQGDTMDSTVIVGDNTNPSGVMGRSTINSTARNIAIRDLTVSKGTIFLRGAYKSLLENVNVYSSLGDYAIMLDKTVDTMLKNVHIYGAAGSGVYVLASTVNSTTLRIDGLYVAHCLRGFTLTSATFFNGMAFENVIIEYCTYVGAINSSKAAVDRDDSGIVFDGLYLEGNTNPLSVVNVSADFYNVISVSQENDFSTIDITLLRYVTHSYTPVVTFTNVQAHVQIQASSTAKVILSNVAKITDVRNNNALTTYVDKVADAFMPFINGTVQSFSTEGISFDNCTRNAGGYIKMGKLCYVKMVVTSNADTPHTLTGLPTYSSYTAGRENVLQAVDMNTNATLACYVYPNGSLKIYPSLPTGHQCIIAGFYFPITT